MAAEFITVEEAGITKILPGATLKEAGVTLEQARFAIMNGGLGKYYFRETAYFARCLWTGQELAIKAFPSIHPKYPMYREMYAKIVAKPNITSPYAGSELSQI
jgi:hypothetical protein